MQTWTERKDEEKTVPLRGVREPKPSARLLCSFFGSAEDFHPTKPHSATAPAAPSSPRSSMKALFQAFLSFTERFGNMLSRIFLTLLYFLVLGPFAVVYRLVADPLRIRPRKSNWWRWVSDNEDLRAARRQD